MARSYRWRPAAREDATAIWRWIAPDSPHAADRLLNKFETVSQMLAESPQVGRARGDLAEGLRSFPVGAYLVFYRQSEYGAEIVRILHGRRDIGPEMF